MSRMFEGVATVPRRELTAAERKQLAAMVVKLFDRWDLDQPTRCELLGLSPKTRATLARYRAGEPLAENRDLLDRVGNLMGIHKSLRLLFPFNADLRYAWPTAVNRALGNQRPIDVMREHGLPGVIAIRDYLDHLRGQ